MRTTLKILLLVILVVPVARGQNPVVAGIAPVLEAGVGYSYVDASVPSQSSLGMNGIQLVGNADVSRRFGVAGDLGYARSFDAYNSGHTADLLTYMAGPVFYPVRKRNMNVYTHLLLGGARETGVNFERNGQIVLGYTNRFAWAAGAGFQYRFSRSFALRVGADYLRTSFFNSNVALQGQSSIRPSVSLIYTFGEGRER
jgi:opacity protein-like surface antigen